MQGARRAQHVRVDRSGCAMTAKLLSKLYDEHRSIAAVLHGMHYLIREHRERGTKTDPAVFRAMLYYLDVFPERLHHPKEERLLFRALRRRSPKAAALLDELDREHAGGQRAIRALEQDLVRFEEGGEAEFPTFAAAVDRFVAGYRDHMHKEEREVMPLAEQSLTREDWAEIEAEWAENVDPLHDSQDESDYQKLFSRIVNIAPPPIGLGPAT
jgi:hemerythrin-like domain-containing protein